MKLAEVYYQNRLSKLLNVSKEFIRDHIVAPALISDFAPYKDAISITVTINGKNHAVQKLRSFITRINTDKIWLFVDDAKDFGPLELSPHFINNILEKLLDTNDELFVLTTPNNLDRLLVEIDLSLITVEIQGDNFVKIWAPSQ